MDSTSGFYEKKSNLTKNVMFKIFFNFQNSLTWREWEKNEMRLFSPKTNRNALKHRVTGSLDTLSQIIATSTSRHVAKDISGHERSPAVFRQ